MESYKAYCDVLLDSLDNQGMNAVVLSVVGADLLYCQYDFQWKSADVANIKMLQPVGYLRNAWTNLSESHGLRNVYFLQPSVGRKISQNFSLESSRWALRKLAARKYQAPTAPANIRAPSGLFDLLFQKKGLLEEMEEIKGRSRNNELVEPSVLPRRQADLLTEVLKKFATNSLHGNTPEGLRYLKIYLWMSSVSSFASTSALVRARVTNWGSHDTESTAFKYLSFSLTIVRAIEARNNWAKLTAFALAPAVAKDDALLKHYHELDVGTMNWRMRSLDPNGYLRIVLFSGAGLRDYVETIAKHGDMQIAPYANLQLALWHRDVGNHDAAIRALRLVVKHTTKLPDAKSQLLALEAWVVVSEIYLTLQKKSDCSNALQQLNATCFGDAESVYPRYRALRAREQLCSARFRLTLDFDLEQGFTHLSRGIDITLEHPGELSAPEVLMVAADLYKTQAVVSLARGELAAAEKIIRQVVGLLLEVTRLCPDGKPLFVSFTPFTLLLRICSWAVLDERLQKIGGLKEWLRSIALETCETLLKCPEFFQLLGIMDACEKQEILGLEALEEYGAAQAFRPWASHFGG